jgi:plastocyanin
MPANRPSLRRLAFALFAFSLSGLCAAANVNVTVTDQDGAAVADAVVYLEPVAGKLPTKPLAGAEISQIKRQFVPRVLVVPVGTAVTFPNLDSVRHQVYSFSAAKTFELKLYAGMPSEPVVFDKAGTAILGCNIHDRMSAWVYVVDTPYFAKSAAGGQAQLQQVPPGDYRLMVWHPAMPPRALPQQVPLSVAKADVDSAVKLAVSAQTLP